jgi:hypothetical protein
MKPHATLLAALCGLLGLCSAQAAVSQPNILVIWGDDIGTWNISHNNRGMMGYQTPNIDRIAKEGVASPTTMRSRVAPPVARPSSAARCPSAPA